MTRDQPVRTPPIPVVLEVGNGHTAWASGPLVLHAFDVLGVKRMRERGCWAFPAKRVQDVAAYLEQRRRVVIVSRVDG